MAEIFGAVASGAGVVSLAIQLADCAVRLKSFCEQVERAPKSLRRIASELSVLSLLLRQIDGLCVEYGSEDADALAESLALCRESTQEVIETTDALSSVFKKYHIAGRVYSALRMRDVKELCSDLERSKNCLMLAFQVFDHRTQVRIMSASRDLALQQSLLLMKYETGVASSRTDTEPALQQATSSRSTAVSGMERDELSLVPFNARHDSYRPRARTALQQQRKHGASSYRFWLPPWFSDRVFALSLSHSYGNWHICLQSSIWQPMDVQTRVYLKTSQLGLMHKMLCDGTVSPFCFADETRWIRSRLNYFGSSKERWTALDFAVCFASLEICDLILRHCSHDYTDVIHRAFEKLCTWVVTKDNEPSATDYEIARRLIELGDIDLESATKSDPWYGEWTLGRPKHVHARFLPLLELNMVPFTTVSPQMRFELLMRHSYESLTPQTLMSLTSRGQPCGLMQLRSAHGNISVLHAIASKMLTITLERRSNDDELRKWKDLLHYLVTEGAELHPRSRALVGLEHRNVTIVGGFTPAMEFATTLLRPSPNYLHALQCWTSALLEAGVDLLEYGKTEERLWKETGFISTLNERCFHHSDTLVSLKFGPTVADYGFLLRWAIRVPIYRAQQTPGSWPRSYLNPMTICWNPRSADDEEGITWVKQRMITLALRVYELGYEGALVTAGYYDVYRNRADDDPGNAILASQNIERHTGNRRRRFSEPESVEGSFRRFSANLKRWATAYRIHPAIKHSELNRYLRRYAWGGWFRSREQNLIDVIWRTMQTNISGYEDRYESEPSPAQVVGGLRMCKEFSDIHGIWPTDCYETFDSSYNGTSQQLSTMEVFEHGFEPCEAFPNCIHQLVHLELNKMQTR